MITTLTLAPDAAGLAQAAQILRDGGLVAIPTETVYGLGADARNSRAVARVYEAKGRPVFNPLIVHVADTDAARRYVQWTDAASTLASAFWPGPLTLVLPLRPDHDLSPLVTAGLPTVAIRVPAHPVAHSVLAALGGPIAAPSANPSGRISPTTTAHVMRGLDGRIEAIIEGGTCDVGVESTIIGLDGPARLLRPGGLPAEAVETALGQPLEVLQPDDTLTAPGQMMSHYAPDAPVRMNAVTAQGAEVMLGFGPVTCDLNLSESGDLIEAAANLFGHLHRLDELKRPIAVSPISDHGLGRAINDRLRRAAAPRS